MFDCPRPRLSQARFQQRIAVVPDLFRGFLDYPETGDSDNDEHDAIEQYNSESVAELAVLLEWEEGPPSINEATQASTLSHVGRDTSFLDEPVPLAEYDGELAQPLHELEYDDRGLLREVKVNEWLASIEEVDDAQFKKINKILLGFSGRRLQNWLTWLREKKWNGKSLLLFLQFRTYWDENCELWERLQWSLGLKFWFRVLDRNSLTRDDSYLLISRRCHCSADDVIDQEWFEDWESFDLWARVALDFFSFASFVMYRSQFVYAEDWRNRRDLQVELDRAADDVVLTMSRSELPAQHRGPRSWFSGQDWYAPIEWHDGLGW